MDLLLQKYNDYMRLVGCKVKYELIDGTVIEVVYKEEKFLHLLINNKGMLSAISIISGLLLQKKFVTVHSLANRIIGFVLFIYPFSFSVIDVRYSSIAVCLLATFAALQESRFIRTKVCGKQVGICH